VNVPEASVTAVPLTTLVGAGVVVVVVVVTGAVGPDPTGWFGVFGGAAASDTAGWVLVDPVAGGNVVTVVLVLAVFPLSVCGSGLGEPLGTEVEVEDDAVADDGVQWMSDGGVGSPAIGNGVVYPLSAMALGAPGDEPELSATDTTIATMPTSDAAPTAFCRRRMSFFF
jgi:hypothetical protein